MRTNGAVEALIPRLFNVRLPISNNTRRTVKSMQEALGNLAHLGLKGIEADPTLETEGPRIPVGLAISRVFEASAQILKLTNLIAAPASQSVWHTLHRAYLCARRHNVATEKPIESSCDLRTQYARTLICGLIPSAALSAHEWAFVHYFVAESRAPLVVIDSVVSDSPETTIWVSPDQDSAPVLFSRRPPGEGTLAFYVNCNELRAEIETALNEFSTRSSSALLLPRGTSSRTARIALQRLRDQLSASRKRRYPRRRQGYRSALCIGFDAICKLLKTGLASEALSEWIVINESPGGYAAMHVSGNPTKIQVGDLIAMKRDDDSHWRISVVRWALSENPEHLEFGLEELSLRAISGHVATALQSEARHTPALLLPAIPPMRKFDAIALSPFSGPERIGNHLFVSDGDKARVMEFTFREDLEQSSGIDIRLISHVAN